MFSVSRYRSTAFLTYCLALAGAHSEAQNYPVRPVRVVAGFPTGAGVDIMTRLVTLKLSETLGQQFIVDNRAARQAISPRSSSRRPRRTATPCSPPRRPSP